MCFPLETCAKNENHDFLMKFSKVDENENLNATNGEIKKKQIKNEHKQHILEPHEKALLK